MNRLGPGSDGKSPQRVTIEGGCEVLPAKLVDPLRGTILAGNKRTPPDEETVRAGIVKPDDHRIARHLVILEPGDRAAEESHLLVPHVRRVWRRVVLRVHVNVKVAPFVIRSSQRPGLRIAV